MHRPLIALFILVAGLMTGGEAMARGAKMKPHAGAQAGLDRLADTMGYRYRLVRNGVTEGCRTNRSCYQAELELTLPTRLPALTPSLFLGLPRIDKVVSDDFALKRINGDLYQLTPTGALKPGARYVVTFLGEGIWLTNLTPMPNAYLAAEGLKPRLVKATVPVVEPQTGLEHLPFVAPLADPVAQGPGPKEQHQWRTPEREFALNAQRHVAQPAPEVVILPRPVKVERPDGAPLDLSGGLTVALVGLDPGAVQPALDELKAAGVATLGNGPPLQVQLDPVLGAEAYRLRAGADGVQIRAGDAAGAAYALRSLAQQVRFEHGYLRPLAVEDAPRFGFRGLHLDIARNFQSKAQILSILEQMAGYKLNRLHFHLADDEGWRLEISGLPELTELGSRRCHDLSEQHCLLPQLGAGPVSTTRDGFLTRQDYKDIITYAAARQIEVIPSFDMPGHSRAAIKAMEARYHRLSAAGDLIGASAYRLIDPDDRTQYESVQNYTDNTLNPCQPSTYRFVEKIMAEVAALHAEAGVPLMRYHIGADETAKAWTASPLCQQLIKDKGLKESELSAFFIAQVAQHVASLGITPAGWSDGMGHVAADTLPAQVQSNSWGPLFWGGVAEAQGQANRGWQIVLSTPDVTYFDMPYAHHPDERGLVWASRGTDLFKVFAFMPQNLPANASVMLDHAGRPSMLDDATPLEPGRGFIGMQGHLWSEMVRSPAIADQMIYPRLMALAERAWRRGGFEPDYQPGKVWRYGDGQVDQAKLAAEYQDFGSRLSAQFAAMDAAGVKYRLPPPGAQIVGGKLEANLDYGRFDILYRTAGGDWRLYAGPVAVSGKVELRTRSTDGKRFSRTVVVE